MQENQNATGAAIPPSAPQSVHVQQNAEPRSYLVMIVLAWLMAPFGLARAYRGDQSGWVRFWIMVGAYVLMFIPLINIVSALATMVLGIWGLVDFFLVYNLKTDTSGMPLHITNRDQNWAKNIRLFLIISMSIVLGLVLLGIILVSLGMFAGMLGGISSYNY